jgi:hypothetical protein
MILATTETYLISTEDLQHTIVAQTWHRSHSCSRGGPSGSILIVLAVVLSASRPSVLLLAGLVTGGFHASTRFLALGHPMLRVF